MDGWEEQFDKEFPLIELARSEIAELKDFIRTVVIPEARSEALEEVEKWLWDNGITHKQSAQALQRKLRSIITNKDV